MRNDPRIRYAQAEGVLTLLDITRVYSGRCNPNADFAGSRPRIGHLANHQDLPRRSLFLVPSCPHMKKPRFFERFFKCLSSIAFQDWRLVRRSRPQGQDLERFISKMGPPRYEDSNRVWVLQGLRKDDPR